MAIRVVVGNWPVMRCVWYFPSSPTQPGSQPIEIPSTPIHRRSCNYALIVNKHNTIVINVYLMFQLDSLCHKLTQLIKVIFGGDRYGNTHDNLSIQQITQDYHYNKHTPNPIE